MCISVTDAIFLLVRSPLIAVGFGSSQQLVGSDVLSSHSGEGRLCRGDVGMAGIGAAEESRCREDNVLGGLGQPGLGVAYYTHESGEGRLQGGVGRCHI
jgi:hypothetical protein